VTDRRSPVRISLNKSETHNAVVNSVDKSDESPPTVIVSLYVIDMKCF